MSFVILIVVLGMLGLAMACLWLAGWLDDNGAPAALALFLYVILASLLLWGASTMQVTE